MNKVAKPISSPGRSEKFPPPLMRFLRSNVGSKSRRRSRASPMFVNKKNTIIETTQEPCSPKVTCIGQVRVRRSNKNKKTTAATSHHRFNRLCRCLRTLRTTSCRSLWSKCVSFFRCKNSGDVTDSPEIGETPKIESPNAAGENGDAINQGLIPRSLPENAFLLTRCRSAPYRCVFRESTVEMTRGEEVEEKIENLKIKKEEKVIEDVENGGVSEENRCNESNGGGEKEAVKTSSLILTRCKSEPARRWDKLLV